MSGANETVLSHPVSGNLEADAEATDFTFDAVFLKHYDRIFAVLTRLVGDRAQAEELADDVFWKFYRQPPNHGDNLGGWLYRTAVRLGIDAIRAVTRRQRYEDAAGTQARETSELHDPLHDVLRAERCRQVRSTLALLKPAHAQILILRYSDLSYKEIAQALGVKSSSIGTRLARAETEFEQCYRALHHEKE